MANEGKYIYCIIGSQGKAGPFGQIGIGERGDMLFAICFNDIAAVVSNAPIKKYPVAREYLLSHERAIEEVMKSYTVLPVRFATIAEDENKVMRILEKEHDRFVKLLRYMENKKELGLKAVFEEKVVYREIVANYKGIKAQKENIAKQPVRQFDLIEIGRLVEEALEEEKTRYKDDILASLTPLVLEVKINSTYGERMILNSAFLVEKIKEPAFDLKLNELTDTYGDKIKFKYMGTVPPFNFINIEINTGNYSCS